MPLSASPNNGYSFSNWTGNVADPNSANTTVTMTAPQSVTADFTNTPVQITVGTNPTGLSFTVDGINYTSTQIFTWNVGSAHTVATTSPQAGAPAPNRSLTTGRMAAPFLMASRLQERPRLHGQL